MDDQSNELKVVVNSEGRNYWSRNMTKFTLHILPTAKLGDDFPIMDCGRWNHKLIKGEIHRLHTSFLHSRVHFFKNTALAKEDFTNPLSPASRLIRRWVGYHASIVHDICINLCINLFIYLICNAKFCTNKEIKMWP